METGIALTIKYWCEQKDSSSLYELDGIEEFRQELASSYISVVQGRPGDLGGLHQLVVEVISNLPLSEVAKFLAEGIAFDLIKSGTKAFVLRPFLAAYKKLRDRNKTMGVDIEEFRVAFSDSVLIISKISDDGIFESLERILVAVAQNYHLMFRDGERPFEIHIPVFEDSGEDRLCRFRSLLDVDETIRNVTSANYLEFWGVWYDYTRTSRVYDVSRRLLIDAEFFTRERYWQEWERRQKKL